MKPSDISANTASQIWRATGGRPHQYFNEETRHYEKFVHYETGQTLGPFLKLNDYKKAAIDAYIHTFRVLPTNV